MPKENKKIIIKRREKKKQNKKKQQKTKNCKQQKWILLVNEWGEVSVFYRLAGIYEGEMIWVVVGGKSFFWVT